jgi:limonene 1,2-monooxygenase
MKEPMNPTKFGCFLSPLHPVGEDPQFLLQNDLRLVEWADTLGFDEFWVGEHHSAGWGLIGSPEVFIASAAERTTHIKLASGVIGAPYHHPLMIAERAALLSHLTRGRFILGMGAGSLAGDMHMLGIHPSEARPRMRQGVETVTALLRGERVTRKETWFELIDARLQHTPYRPSEFEIVVASAATPFGVELAGELGVNVLSHGAPPWGAVRPGTTLGVENLPNQWARYEETCENNGHVADRANWRLSFPIHVSQSTDSAIDEIYDGWVRQRRDLWIDTLGIPMSSAPGADEKAFLSTLKGKGIILGSPAEVAAQIEEVAELTGGFGTLLLTLQDWAEHPAQRRSLELFASQVVPLLTSSTSRQIDSQRWSATNRTNFQTAFSGAREQEIKKAGAARIG